MITRGTWHERKPKGGQPAWTLLARNPETVSMVATWLLVGFGIALLIFTIRGGGAVAIVSGAGFFKVIRSMVERRCRRRALPEVEAMMEWPSESLQFPVDISLACGDLEYGNDMGIASFVDSWLIYQGLATDFSLQIADVTKAAPVEGYPNAWDIWFRDGDRTGTVRLHPRDETRIAGEKRVGNSYRFDRAVSRWKHSASVPADPVLPVMFTRPRLRSELRRTASETAGMLGFSALLALVSLAIFGGLSWVFLSCVVAALCFAVGAGTLRVRLEQADELDLGRTPNRRPFWTARLFGSRRRAELRSRLEEEG